MGWLTRNCATEIARAVDSDDVAGICLRGKPGWGEMYPPMPQGFCHVPFGDIDAIAERIDKHTLAVMLEPIQGEAGVVVPPKGFLKELRDLCSRNQVLLILDEVQTGMGRTGELYAHHHEGVVPCE